MKFSKNDIVGQVVAHDYRAAAVFKQFGIDFCCKGNRSIADVCTRKNLSPETVLERLARATEASDAPADNFKDWDLDLLADYIEKRHHRYVTEKIAEIMPFLNKVVRVHGERHPELLEIEALFRGAAEELIHHMKKEEMILFPYVRNLVRAARDGKETPAPPFGTVENPIRVMQHEHDTEGDRFRKIAELSNNYTPPEDACTTYRVVFLMLKAFEEDLHLHIHLENNILFPKAIELEQSGQPA